MPKIKILRIITRLNIGGPAIHAALLTKEFNNDKYESRLICGSVSKGEGDMGYLAGLYGIKPVFIPQLKREISPLSDLMAFWRMLKYIKKYKPDIIHTHTAKAGTLGRLAGVLSNVPVMAHTFHGHVFHGYFNNTLTKIFIHVERLLARFTDMIVAISENQKDEVVKKYKITGSDKCRVVKLGFDLNKFLNLDDKKNIFRNKFTFKKNDILVGMIGRLTAIKNHKMFIDTMAHINKNANRDLFDRMKFIIIGDGELKEELSEYGRKKGLGQKIFFTGWVNDIDEVYADLDIVTLTSINEGTPVSLIEAMASSKPVISTNVGGIKDAVGDIGILVNCNDHVSMGERIVELASSLEKREKLGKQGKEFVRNTYSKERLVTELGELYRNLLAKKIKEKNL